MNLFPKKSLEFLIITYLQKQGWVIVDLIEELRKFRPKLSKQAVYQILRNLKKSEIVVIASKRVSLSSLWIDRMHEFFTVAKYAYQGINSNDSLAESFLQMEDGDRIVYEFKNPIATDIFWGHTSNILRSIMPAETPMLIYEPHNWFLLSRRDTEQDIMNQSASAGHPFYVYIPNTTPLDKYTKSLFQKPHSTYLQDLHYFKENFYANTHGDYIIEVVIDPKTQKLIDNFYNTYSLWNEEAALELKKIISHMKGRNKLTISRSNKKAERYKKIFKKYFLLK
jgi:hypothetical protein